MHPIKDNYPIYKTLALENFLDCDAKEIANLRVALYGLIRGLEQTGDHQTPAGKEFYRYLMIAHLIGVKNLY